MAHSVSINSLDSSSSPKNSVFYFTVSADNQYVTGDIFTRVINNPLGDVRINSLDSSSSPKNSVFYWIVVEDDDSADRNMLILADVWGNAVGNYRPEPPSVRY